MHEMSHPKIANDITELIGRTPLLQVRIRPDASAIPFYPTLKQAAGCVRGLPDSCTLPRS